MATIVSYGSSKFVCHIASTLAKLLYFAISVLLIANVVDSPKRGFFCNDISIGYPSKHETIGVKTLFLFALICPYIIIMFFDTILNSLLIKTQKKLNSKPSQTEIDKYDKDVSKSSRRQEKEDEDSNVFVAKSIKRCELFKSNDTETGSSSNSFSRSNSFSSSDSLIKRNENNYCSIEEHSIDIIIRKPIKKSNIDQGEVSIFLFGFSTTMFITGIGKISVTSFRPNFLDYCKPNVNCSNQNMSSFYIESFVCTNSIMTNADFAYISSSWPSGKLFFF